MSGRPTPERLAEIRGHWDGVRSGAGGVIDMITDLLAEIDALQAQLDQRSAGFEEWLASSEWQAAVEASRTEGMPPVIRGAWQAAVASQQPVREALVACVAALGDSHQPKLQSSQEARNYPDGHCEECGDDWPCPAHAALALARAALGQ